MQRHHNLQDISALVQVFLLFYPFCAHIISTRYQPRCQASPTCSEHWEIFGAKVMCKAHPVMAKAAKSSILAPI